MKTRILSREETDIATAAQAIRAGQLVGFPTETVYGLGADAFQANAIAQVFAAKERPTFDPLIVHVHEYAEWKTDPLAYLLQLKLIDISSMSELAKARANQLAREFWPGPLTLILPRSTHILDLITAGLDTVAVRMPNHPIAQKLLAQVGGPIVGPSANRFGRISPTTANEVVMELDTRIPYVLDGGRASVGIESTVIFIQNDGTLRLLRAGGLAPEKIASALDAPILGREGLPSSAAPGLMKSHYAPQKPMILLPKNISRMEPADWQAVLAHIKQLEADHGRFDSFALLLFDGSGQAKTTLAAAQLARRVIAIKTLSVNQDLNEAAHLLFGSMRVLDLSPADCILAEPCEILQGLGWAIQDRLQKAATGI
jgi:L-threonylcarbamoyladenylate synthase